MINALHCPKCGSQKIALQSVDGDEVLTPVNEDVHLVMTSAGEVHCLTCGHRWNPVQQIRQELDDQDQADALDFAQRKETFYHEVETGHLSQARRLVPKEARFILRRAGLRAAYAYLKSLDKELIKFKRTYWLIGSATMLLVAGGLVYACS